MKRAFKEINPVDIPEEILQRMAAMMRAYPERFGVNHDTDTAADFITKVWNSPLLRAKMADDFVDRIEAVGRTIPPDWSRQQVAARLIEIHGDCDHDAFNEYLDLAVSVAMEARDKRDFGWQRH